VLLPPIRERIAAETTATWLERLEGIPIAPVHDIAQAAAHEQTRATGLLQEIDETTTLALPLSTDGDHVAHRSPPPTLGAHSREVLAELGLSDAEIDGLSASGVTHLA
jgi:crotonobetainyl-CoA:carnitine CoA-transferase CaiB-like acyl-CoA transferase